LAIDLLTHWPSTNRRRRLASTAPRMVLLQAATAERHARDEAEKRLRQASRI